MVTTRGHPKTFPESTTSPSKPSRARSSSPTKRSTRASASSPGESPNKKSSRKPRATLAPEMPVISRNRSRSPPAAPSSSLSPTPARARKPSRNAGWTHTPSLLTLIWLVVSVPLVVWDTGYVFLRPHTMPGGKYVWPFYKPYQLYGMVDYIYGAKAWNDRNGFTAAQSALNVIETLAYLVYLYLVYAFSEHESITGRGAPPKRLIGTLAHSRTLHGRVAAYAAILAFGTAVATLSKTVLYWLNEAFGGFANIGHNSLSSLVFLWIIPNGLWIVFPLYMVYVFGSEIIEGLEVAASSSEKTR